MIKIKIEYLGKTCIIECETFDQLRSGYGLIGVSTNTYKEIEKLGIRYTHYPDNTGIHIGYSQGCKVQELEDNYFITNESFHNGPNVKTIDVAYPIFFEKEELWMHIEEYSNDDEYELLHEIYKFFCRDIKKEKLPQPFSSMSTNELIKEYAVRFQKMYGNMLQTYGKYMENNEKILWDFSNMELFPNRTPLYANRKKNQPCTINDKFSLINNYVGDLSYNLNGIEGTSKMNLKETYATQAYFAALRLEKLAKYNMTDVKSHLKSHLSHNQIEEIKKSVELEFYRK